MTSVYKQGEIYFFNLNPAKGSEERKVRPYIIVSNEEYNRYFNTIIIAPISSSKKYQNEEKYKVSPLFIPMNVNEVSGTILLQHIRSIDPQERRASKLQGKINDKVLSQITETLKQFF